MKEWMEATSRRWIDTKGKRELRGTGGGGKDKRKEETKERKGNLCIAKLKKKNFNHSKQETKLATNRRGKRNWIERNAIQTDKRWSASNVKREMRLYNHGSWQRWRSLGNGRFNKEKRNTPSPIPPPSPSFTYSSFSPSFCYHNFPIIRLPFPVITTTIFTSLPQLLISKLLHIIPPLPINIFEFVTTTTTYPL